MHLISKLTNVAAIRSLWLVPYKNARGEPFSLHLTPHFAKNLDGTTFEKWKSGNGIEKHWCKYIKNYDLHIHNGLLLWWSRSKVSDLQKSSQTPKTILETVLFVKITCFLSIWTIWGPSRTFPAEMLRGVKLTPPPSRIGEKVNFGK